MICAKCGKRISSRNGFRHLCESKNYCRACAYTHPHALPHKGPTPCHGGWAWAVKDSKEQNAKEK
jgi:hypothetical protein